MSENTDIAKQILVIRKDLKMRMGKVAAQSAHASLGVFLEMGDWPDHDCFSISNVPSDMIEWMKGAFTKVGVFVQSEEELDALHEQAKQAGLPCCLIVDSGKTEFRGVPTKTVLAIGPALSSRLDPITGNLPLL